jgi:hypothetical protein
MQKRFSRPPVLSEEKQQTRNMESVPSDFEGKKTYLTQWIQREKIPGKFQAWFSVVSEPEQADWRLISEKRGKHQMLMIEAPYKGMTVPALVLDIDAQLRKDIFLPCANHYSKCGFAPQEMDDLVCGSNHSSQCRCSTRIQVLRGISGTQPSGSTLLPSGADSPFFPL